MKLEDFAEKREITTKSGGTRKWIVNKVDVLLKYLEESEFNIQKLANNLNMSYSSVKRLLVQANLYDKCNVKAQTNKGGRPRTTSQDQYGYIYADAEHDYIDQNGDKKRNYEHIVVAENKLGRKLGSDELVHHINLDKTDNSPENLMICTNSQHRVMHQDLEHLAGRLIEAGFISFVPDLGQYIYVGPGPRLEKSVGKGFVNVDDVMGNDADVVNSARVSFGKRIDQIREQDKKLLSYLANNGHTSPFRHCYVRFHVKAPEFVARQWYKHVIGSEYTFKDQPWNEISGRYVQYDMESWIPEHFRKQSSDNKQGSTLDFVENEEALLQKYKDHVEKTYQLYNELIQEGVCKEQARTILPVNFWTEWYWTASLQAVQHFVKLRLDPHAQVEIQEYAQAIDDQMRALFPNAWLALNK